jgi:hypothetical protein
LHGSKTDRGNQEPRISERAIANFGIHRVTVILRGAAKSSGLRYCSHFRSWIKTAWASLGQIFWASGYEFVT